MPSGDDYTLLPYTSKEYENPTLLMEQTNNFVLAYHKGSDDQPMQMYLRTIQLATKDFALLPTDEMQSTIEGKKYFYDIFLRSVKTVALKPYRDRIYNVFSLPEVTDTALIVSAVDLKGGHYMLSRKLRELEIIRQQQSHIPHNGVQDVVISGEIAKYDLYNAAIIAKVQNKEPVFDCKIMLATNEKKIAELFWRALPQDHGRFHYQRIMNKNKAIEKARKLLTRDIRNYWVWPNAYAYVAVNFFGQNHVVRDTILSRSELATIASLPVNAERFNMVFGQTPSESIGLGRSKPPPMEDDAVQ